jgi:hypothetical protein
MVKVTKRSLLVELARARVVWPDIKTALEFKIAPWLFAVCIFGLVVLGVAFKFAPSRAWVSEHPPPGYVVRQQDVLSP